MKNFFPPYIKVHCRIFLIIAKDYFSCLFHFYVVETISELSTSLGGATLLKQPFTDEQDHVEIKTNDATVDDKCKNKQKAKQKRAKKSSKCSGSEDDGSGQEDSSDESKSEGGLNDTEVDSEEERRSKRRKEEKWVRGTLIIIITVITITMVNLILIW